MIDLAGVLASEDIRDCIKRKNTDIESYRTGEARGGLFVVNITSELSPWLIVVEDTTVIIINCPMNVNIYILLEHNYRNKHKLSQL